MAYRNTIARASRLYDNISAIKKQHPNRSFTQRLMNEFEMTVHRMLLDAPQKSPLTLHNAFHQLETRLARCITPLPCRQNAAKKNISLKKIAALS